MIKPIKYINNYFTKREQWLILVSLSLFIMSLGAVSNMYVMRSNEGKMPIKTQYEQGIAGEYIYLNDIKQANNWFLSDIIKIGNYMWSIGDTMAILGVLGFGGSWFGFLYLTWKNKITT